MKRCTEDARRMLATRTHSVISKVWWRRNNGLGLGFRLSGFQVMFLNKISFMLQNRNRALSWSNMFGRQWFTQQNKKVWWAFYQGVAVDRMHNGQTSTLNSTKPGLLIQHHMIPLILFPLNGHIPTDTLQNLAEGFPKRVEADMVVMNGSSILTPMLLEWDDKQAHIAVNILITSY